MNFPHVYVALLMAPALALAQMPSDQPDALRKPFEDYATSVRRALQGSYLAYTGLTQPHHGLRDLHLPPETLDRLISIEGLTALPDVWVQKLNDLGSKAEARGQSDAAGPMSPIEYRPFESLYIGVEPSGSPLQTGASLSAHWPNGAPPPLTKLPFAAMRALVDQAPSAARDAQWDKLAHTVEMGLPDQAWAAVARALVPLRTAIDHAADSAAALPLKPGQTPWDALDSRALHERIDRYLAERYFKGRWIANRGAPQTTGTGTATTPPAAGSTGSGDVTVASPGGTGNGQTGQMSSGTGTGNGSASPEPGTVSGTGTGTGTGTGAGTGARTVPSSGSGTGNANSGSSAAH